MDQRYLHCVCTAVWMGLFVLLGRNLVTSARAFPTTLSPARLPRHTLTTSSLDHILLLRASSSSTPQKGDPEEEDSDLKGVPATGWNHNPPSNPSFWGSVNGVNGEGNSPERPTDRSEASSETTNPPRTGWLHNTKSKTEKASPSEQEQQAGGTSSNKAQQRLKQAMLQQERNHRILSPPTFHACGKDRQIVVTEHRLSIPVFRNQKSNPTGPRIDLAFSIVEEVKDETTWKWFSSLQTLSPQQRAAAYIQKASLKDADDMMVYLQGGPGFGAPAPVAGLGFSQDSSWGARALNKFSRIVLMDQRGTGKSTPITKQSLELRFPDLFLLDDKDTKMDLKELAVLYPEEYLRFQTALKDATDYMGQFRADNIVQDAEYLKEALMLPTEPGAEEPGPRPWGCALGQSFGGFCMMSYLSLVERPPRICLLTGGIAPMLTPAYDAYSKLWDRVRERSWKYYDMYPGDIALVKKIVKRLLEKPAVLPSGGRLTARRFLQYGMSLGGSPSSFASMHDLFQSAFLQPESEETASELTRAFVKYFDSAQPFDDHPIYYWLHESIYADGPQNSPTNWAAHRAYEDKIQTPTSDFDYHLTCQIDSDSQPTLFFGEMVFPWMSEDYAECGGVGCTALATALATKEDWGPLYDADHMRQVLENGSSRAAAAVYYDDLYVDFDCSMKVASRGGPLEKCKVYVTNDYQHSGLRDDGATIFGKLYGMATGSVRTPS